MPDFECHTYYDAYVQEISPTTNFATPTVLTCYQSADNVDACRVYVWFNLGGIPTPCIITKCELWLYRTGQYSNGDQIELRLPTSDWNYGTITWNTQPSVGTVKHTWNSSTSIGWAKRVSDMSAILQDWLDGVVTNRGIMWRLTNEDASALRGEAVSGSGSYPYQPYMDIHYNRTPNVPDQLSPTGGESVGTLTPVISGRFVDVDAEDNCNMIQIIIYESDGATQKYDTGQVAPDSSPVSNGNTFQYTVPSAANLAWGQTYKYKVRVRDQHNATNSWSSYSALQSFKCENPPTVSISTPADGGYVYTSAPQITWSYYQAQGLNQMSYRVRIATSTDFTNDTFYDTGVINSSNAYHDCPVGTLNANGTYYVRVDVVASNNGTAYDEHSSGFTYSSIMGPSTIVLTLYEEGAKVKAQWERATANPSSYWELYMRKYGETEWELVNTELDDTMRSCWDYTCQIGTLEYAVVYVDENGYKSNPEACKGSITVSFVNWWLSSNDDPTKCLELWGVSNAPFSKPDMKMTSYPLGRSAALVEQYDLPKGIDMELSLTFRAEDGLTAQEYYEALEDIRDYVEGDIFLKSNMGHRWKVDVSNVRINFVHSMIEIYEVSCKVVSV